MNASHADHTHITCRSHTHHMQITHTSHADHMNTSCSIHSVPLRLNRNSHLTESCRVALAEHTVPIPSTHDPYSKRLQQCRAVIDEIVNTERTYVLLLNDILRVCVWCGVCVCVRVCVCVCDVVCVYVCVCVVHYITISHLTILSTSPLSLPIPTPLLPIPGPNLILSIPTSIPGIQGSTQCSNARTPNQCC